MRRVQLHPVLLVPHIPHLPPPRHLVVVGPLDLDQNLDHELGLLCHTGRQAYFWQPCAWQFSCCHPGHRQSRHWEGSPVLCDGEPRRPPGRKGPPSPSDTALAVLQLGSSLFWHGQHQPPIFLLLRGQLWVSNRHGKCQNERGLALSLSNPCAEEPEVVDIRSRTSIHQDHQGSFRHSLSLLLFDSLLYFQKEHLTDISCRSESS